MYTPNNIRFRIVSSNSIAQYKMDQAFDFNELVNNADYSFSQESREILLLHYELWFRFIIRIERVLIKNGNATDDIGTLAQNFVMLARDICSEIDDVTQSHPNLFKSHTKTLVKKAFAPFLLWIFDTIANTDKDNMYVAFPKIVTTISASLHNILFILQEIESIKANAGDSSKHFLSYTEETEAVRSVVNSCPMQIRAKLYKAAFGSDSFNIKNYAGDAYDNGCGACSNHPTCEAFTVLNVDAYDDPHTA